MTYQKIGLAPDRHLEGSARSKIGVFVLSSDQGIEAEIAEILPPDVIAHIARMPSYVDCTLRSTTHELELAATADLFRACPGIEAYIYGCTSGELTFGRQLLVKKIQKETGCEHVITPIAAAADALMQMSLPSTSILSPYDRELNEILVDHLATLNISVDQVYEFTLPDDKFAPLVKQTFFIDAARAISRDNPTSLLIPCNALSVVKHIDVMEDLLRAPVITSTQVSIWAALRVIHTPKIPQLNRNGQLFLSLDRSFA